MSDRAHQLADDSEHHGAGDEPGGDGRHVAPLDAHGQLTFPPGGWTPTCRMTAPCPWWSGAPTGRRRSGRRRRTLPARKTCPCYTATSPLDDAYPAACADAASAWLIWPPRPSGSTFSSAAMSRPHAVTLTSPAAAGTMSAT